MRPGPITKELLELLRERFSENHSNVAPSEVGNGLAGAFESGRWAGLEEAKMTPIPIVIACPKCREPHIDEGEWETRPHKTHQCQACLHEWRPANVPTVGVRSL